MTARSPLSSGLDVNPSIMQMHPVVSAGDASAAAAGTLAALAVAVMAAPAVAATVASASLSSFKRWRARGRAWAIAGTSAKGVAVKSASRRAADVVAASRA